MTNPYRAAFYQSQSAWHEVRDLEELRERHLRRVPYYAWYTQDWLPLRKEARIVEIGAGGGQFQFFLQQQGYSNAIGIDIDRQQAELAQSLGLNVERVSAKEFLEAERGPVDCVVGFDILEHLTLEEAYEILNGVMSVLASNGSLILYLSRTRKARPDCIRATRTSLTSRRSPRLRSALCCSATDSRASNSGTRGRRRLMRRDAGIAASPPSPVGLRRFVIGCWGSARRRFGRPSCSRGRRVRPLPSRR